MVLERKRIFFETFTKQFGPRAVPSHVYVNVRVRSLLSHRRLQHGCFRTKSCHLPPLRTRPFSSVTAHCGPLIQYHSLLCWSHLQLPVVPVTAKVAFKKGPDFYFPLCELDHQNRGSKMQLGFYSSSSRFGEVLMETSLFTSWLTAAFSPGPSGQVEALSFPGTMALAPCGAGWTLRGPATSSVSLAGSV